MKQVAYWFILIYCFSALSLKAQNTLEYQTPPQAITDLILSPLSPELSVSPTGHYLLFLYNSDLPSIDEQAMEDIRLAGRRILKQTNAQRVSRKIVRIELKNKDQQQPIELKNQPINGRFISYLWAPDGKKVAFAEETSQGIRLWILDCESGIFSQPTQRTLNCFFTTRPYTWHNGSDAIIAYFVPTDRGMEPKSSTQTIKPITFDCAGEKQPVRTFQDLLSNSYDEDLFDYYATGTLNEISLVSNSMTQLKSKGIYTQYQTSPSGEYLLTHRVNRPYSYLVPYTRFPATIEVTNLTNTQATTIATLPLLETVPMGHNSTYPVSRDFSWNPNQPATLVWIDPLDEGNGRNVVKYRDQLMTVQAPFTEQPKAIAQFKLRCDQLYWGNSTHLFISCYDGETRHGEMLLVNPTNENREAELLYSFHSEDLYGNRGSLIQLSDKNGFSIVYSPDKYKTIYFSGRGYSSKGAYPFVDSYTIANQKTKRIWQAQDPYYEYPISFSGLSKNILITSRESNQLPPNYYQINCSTGKEHALSNFKHPYPQLKDVQVQTICYKRKDGVMLSGTLYLPANYQNNTKLPTILWAYPTEYKNNELAGQRSDSPNRFIRVGRTSPILWVTQGYAVLNNASFPIIGQGSAEPNDSYIEQLVDNAQAAIDKLDQMGVCDKKRVAVGGHSYGAFMTANLLAHCDLFAAGIARSGAYNRTLTPFGFQNEERTFWEAPDVYLKMSPFVTANRLKTPILLIHGEDDNNTGTFTIQSERLFAALKGNGGTARLVLLPHESHSYLAKESVLHQAWETDQWLDKYVKNRK